MRHYLLLTTFLGLWAWQEAQAQQTLRLPIGEVRVELEAPANFKPCGTGPEHLQSTRAFQQQLKAQGGLSQLKNSGPRNTIYVPMSLHIIGRDDSTGFGNLSNILASFCQLNQDFAGSGIQFFIEEPIHYHANSAWYRHDSVRIGGRMMLQENIPNTVNVYFAQNPAGTCGYNLPYAGVAMNYSCLGGHTFAHELGHNFGVQHTFLGWEGGVSWDNSVQPNFSQPAPTTVTYNYTEFKEVMFTNDTLIIDTALVELVARSNCYDAADGFCDTEADYLAYRWLCNSSGNSTVTQLDPTGASFTSRGEYIMSYSGDNCQTRFTAEQIAAMNNHLNTRRTNLLGRSPINTVIQRSDIELLHPANNSLVYQDNLVFRWRAVPGATHYYLEVDHSMNGVMVERVLTTDTFFQSSFRFAPRNPLLAYTWRLVPFNQGYTCVGPSAEYTFNGTTTPPLSIQAEETLAPWQIRVFPQPLASGQSLRVSWTSRQAGQANYRLFNALGQVLLQQQVRLFEGEQFLEIPGLSPGYYLLQFEQNGRIHSEKILVH